MKFKSVETSSCLVLVVLVMCCGNVMSQSSPFYSIAASDSIRQGENYRFSTFAENLAETLLVNYTITGLMSDGVTVSLYKPHSFIVSEEIQEYEFETSYLLEGEYAFLAEIYNPITQETIEERWTLNFLPKRFHIVIQTDKELYRAQDLIRYRVFAFDADTKPVNVGEDLVITVHDPNGFKMREITRPTFSKGRYNEEFQLSDFIIEGLWTIKATIGDQVFEKKITAEIYELPLFTAEIGVASEISITDETFPVRIAVDYTFGRTMNGIAIVRFFRFTTVEIFTKTLNIGSESGIFEVDILNDLGVKKDEEIGITLEFTDTMADRTINATAKVNLRTILAVLKLEAHESFRRNENFEFLLKTEKFDGSPAAEDTFVTVEVLRQRGCALDEVTSQWSCEDDISFQDFVTDASGVLHGVVAAEDYQYISLQAYCKKCVASDHLAELHEPSFEVKTVGPSPRVGSEVVIEVETIFEISSGFCFMMAKNIHKHLTRVSFVDGLTRFSFTPDSSYAPVTQVTCVGIDVYGEHHETETSINMDELPNNISMELLTETVKPGQNASLRVSGALGSVISLSAVDKRLIKLQRSKGLGTPWASIRNQVSQFSIEQVLRSRNYGVSRVLEIVETTTDIPATAPPVVFSAKKSKQASHPAIMQSKAKKAAKDDLPDTENDYTRSNFQEVFLWIDIDIEHADEDDPSHGSQIIEFPVPDSITAYSISGLGFGPNGAGVVENPPIVTVFQDFFIEVDMPFSMKQSETLVQTITVFNYMNVEQNVLCNVVRNDRFEIGYPLLGWQIGTQSYFRSFLAEPNNVYPFKIGIQPKKPGIVPITVRCGGLEATDTLTKNLNVIPDGIERSITHTRLLLKPSIVNIDVNLRCDIPPVVAPETVTTQISFVGDLQGDVLTNLGHLLFQPSGCGEQNLARFGNTIFLYAYMRKSGQLTDAIAATILTYVEGIGGMQNHMTLRMPNGAFRYFLKKENPSTFLTAFSIKILREAQTFTTVDQNVIDTALAWLLTKQEPDGGFYEDQDALLKTHHGGLKDKTALAAYIAILLSQIRKNTGAANLETPLNNVINYIIRTHNENNAYQLAMTCYALFLVDHALFETKYQKLLTMATETNEMMYWEVTDGNVLNVETAANALLFISKVSYEKSVKIGAYLISRKNANGGWSSTTDTIAAIEALTELHDLQRNYDGGLDLLIGPEPNGNPFTVQIERENLLEMHTYALAPQTRSVTILARGLASGKVTASFTCRYFEKFEEFVPRFNVEHVFINSCLTPLKMRICVSFIAKQGDNLSNMVIVKVNTPSGFRVDDATPWSPSVQLLETENQHTRAIVYLDSVGQELVCFEIHMIRSSIVNNLESSLIEVVDYYSPEKRAEHFYSIDDNMDRC